MKILVPIDFSVFSDFAVSAAADIIKEVVNGEVHLYHCSSIPDDWEDLSAEEKFHDTFHKTIAIKARDKMEVIKKNLEAQGIKCFYHYTGGKFLENIEEVIEQIEFDLIVMGSHGASGREEWRIGSNAQKVIRKLHKNVLVVKNEIKDFRFSKALFVTGLNVEDQEAFRQFLIFISNFENDEIHVLSIDTPSFFSQPKIVIDEAFKLFDEIAADYKIKTHFYPSRSVDLGVKAFTKENEIDLIAISNHKRHPLKRLISGSNVEMIVNHSELPVLSIDY